MCCDDLRARASGPLRLPMFPDPSESKSDPRCAVVYVLRGTRVREKLASEEMRVVHGPNEVPVDLVMDLRLDLTSNVA